MEERINEMIEEDEKLLWEGRPEAFQTLDKTNKSHFIKSSIITAVVTIIVLGGYILAIRRTGAELKMGLVVIIALLSLYLIFNIFIQANRLRGKTGYAITDKRLIVVSGDAKGIPYSQIPLASIRTDEDGHSSLLCGAHAVKAPPSKWRGSAAIGIRTDSETGICDDLVMYAISEPEKVRNILKPYLTVN